MTLQELILALRDKNRRTNSWENKQPAQWDTLEMLQALQSMLTGVDLAGKSARAQRLIRGYLKSLGAIFALRDELASPRDIEISKGAELDAVLDNLSNLFPQIVGLGADVLGQENHARIAALQDKMAELTFDVSPEQALNNEAEENRRKARKAITDAQDKLNQLIRIIHRDDVKEPQRSAALELVPRYAAQIVVGNRFLHGEFGTIFDGRQFGQLAEDMASDPQFRAVVTVRDLQVGLRLASNMSRADGEGLAEAIRQQGRFMAEGGDLKGSSQGEVEYRSGPIYLGALRSALATLESTGTGVNLFGFARRSNTEKFETVKRNIRACIATLETGQALMVQQLRDLRGALDAYLAGKERPAGPAFTQVRRDACLRLYSAIGRRYTFGPDNEITDVSDAGWRDLANRFNQTLGVRYDIDGNPIPQPGYLDPDARSQQYAYVPSGTNIDRVYRDAVAELRRAIDAPADDLQRRQQRTRAIEDALVRVLALRRYGENSPAADRTDVEREQLEKYEDTVRRNIEQRRVIRAALADEALLRRMTEAMAVADAPGALGWKNLYTEYRNGEVYRDPLRAALEQMAATAGVTARAAVQRIALNSALRSYPPAAIENETAAARLARSRAALSELRTEATRMFALAIAAERHGADHAPTEEEYADALREAENDPMLGEALYRLEKNGGAGKEALYSALVNGTTGLPRLRSAEGARAMLTAMSVVSVDDRIAEAAADLTEALNRSGWDDAHKAQTKELYDRLAALYRAKRAGVRTINGRILGEQLAALRGDEAYAAATQNVFAEKEALLTHVGGMIAVEYDAAVTALRAATPEELADRVMTALAYRNLSRAAADPIAAFTPEQLANAKEEARYSEEYRAILRAVEADAAHVTRLADVLEVPGAEPEASFRGLVNEFNTRYPETQPPAGSLEAHYVEAMNAAMRAFGDRGSRTEQQRAAAEDNYVRIFALRSLAMAHRAGKYGVPTEQELADAVNAVRANGAVMAAIRNSLGEEAAELTLLDAVNRADTLQDLHDNRAAYEQDRGENDPPYADPLTAELEPMTVPGLETRLAETLRLLRAEQEALTGVGNAELSQKRQDRLTDLLSGVVVLRQAIREANGSFVRMSDGEFASRKRAVPQTSPYSNAFQSELRFGSMAIGLVGTVLGMEDPERLREEMFRRSTVPVRDLLPIMSATKNSPDFWDVNKLKRVYTALQYIRELGEEGRVNKTEFNDRVNELFPKERVDEMNRRMEDGEVPIAFRHVRNQLALADLLAVQGENGSRSVRPVTGEFERDNAAARERAQRVRAALPDLIAARLALLELEKRMNPAEPITDRQLAEEIARVKEGELYRRILRGAEESVGFASEIAVGLLEIDYLHIPGTEDERIENMIREAAAKLVNAKLSAADAELADVSRENESWDSPASRENFLRLFTRRRILRELAASGTNAYITDDELQTRVTARLQDPTYLAALNSRFEAPNRIDESLNLEEAAYVANLRANDATLRGAAANAVDPETRAMQRAARRANLACIIAASRLAAESVFLDPEAVTAAGERIETSLEFETVMRVVERGGKAEKEVFDKLFNLDPAAMREAFATVAAEMNERFPREVAADSVEAAYNAQLQYLAALAEQLSGMTLRERSRPGVVQVFNTELARAVALRNLGTAGVGALSRPLDEAALQEEIVRVMSLDAFRGVAERHYTHEVNDVMALLNDLGTLEEFDARLRGGENAVDTLAERLEALAKPDCTTLLAQSEQALNYRAEQMRRRYQDLADAAADRQAAAQQSYNTEMETFREEALRALALRALGDRQEARGNYVPTEQEIAERIAQLRQDTRLMRGLNAMTANPAAAAIFFDAFRASSAGVNEMLLEAGRVSAAGLRQEIDGRLNVPTSKTAWAEGERDAVVRDLFRAAVLSRVQQPRISIEEVDAAVEQMMNTRLNDGRTRREAFTALCETPEGARRLIADTPARRLQRAEAALNAGQNAEQSLAELITLHSLRVNGQNAYSPVADADMERYVATFRGQEIGKNLLDIARLMPQTLPALRAALDDAKTAAELSAALDGFHNRNLAELTRQRGIEFMGGYADRSREGRRRLLARDLDTLLQRPAAERDWQQVMEKVCALKYLQDNWNGERLKSVLDDAAVNEGAARIMNSRERRNLREYLAAHPDAITALAEALKQPGGAEAAAQRLQDLRSAIRAERDANRVFVPELLAETAPKAVVPENKAEWAEGEREAFVDGFVRATILSFMPDTELRINRRDLDERVEDALDASAEGKTLRETLMERCKTPAEAREMLRATPYGMRVALEGAPSVENAMRCAALGRLDPYAAVSEDVLRAAIMQYKDSEEGRSLYDALLHKPELAEEYFRAAKDRQLDVFRRTRVEPANREMEQQYLGGKSRKLMDSQRVLAGARLARLFALPAESRGAGFAEQVKEQLATVMFVAVVSEQPGYSPDLLCEGMAQKLDAILKSRRLQLMFDGVLKDPTFRQELLQLTSPRSDGRQLSQQFETLYHDSLQTFEPREKLKEVQTAFRQAADPAQKLEQAKTLLALHKLIEYGSANVNVARVNAELKAIGDLPLFKNEIAQLLRNDPEKLAQGLEQIFDPSRAADLGRLTADVGKLARGEYVVKAPEVKNENLKHDNGGPRL